MSKKTVASPPPLSTVTPVWWIGISLVLTLVAYIPVFNAGFISWDDPDYVTGNELIRNLSNLRSLLLTPVQGNYHPLTMLTLALNYAAGGLNPAGYHLVNLILHLANVFLVFCFIRILTKGKYLAAFITALLFGIHPMHTESVAWVSERKDVLYTFFFLLGLISYTKYIHAGKPLRLVASLTWFVLSILSKPAAIIFPVVLFVIDFFLGRRLTLRSVLEKLPFLIVAGIFAWLTVSGQSTAGATDIKGNFPLSKRIFFGFYGFLMYALKMFIPVNLSAFYPFPPVNEPLPVIYYISPVIILGLTAWVIWSLKKSKICFFGMAFYAVTLILVVQFYIVGSAILAERYTYVPYIGLFFIIGFYTESMLEKKRGWRTPVVAGIACVALLFTGMTYTRAGKWKDDVSLWEDALDSHPSSRAYDNLARQYKDSGETAKAVELYTKAIRMNKVDGEALLNRGNIYFVAGKLDSALADYNAVLALDPTIPKALVNRGALLARKGNYEQALEDFAKAEAQDSMYDQLWFNRGITYHFMGKPAEAIRDYNRYLSKHPDDAGILNSVGLCQVALNDFQGGLETYSRAISLEQNAVYYLNRAYAHYRLRNLPKALEDALKAKGMGADVNPEFLKAVGGK